MKILLLGDTHGNVEAIERAFRHAKKYDAERILQLGDFGFGWKSRQIEGGQIVDDFSYTVSNFTDHYGIEIDWLDGNHENHIDLNDISLDKDGARTIAPGVRHLPRGYRFELGGRSFLAAGGAVSVDKKSRVPYISWWPGEELSDADVMRCSGPPVDILLTHDVPLESIEFNFPMIGSQEAEYDSYMNRKRISMIAKEATPKWLFHGHMHHFYTQEPSSNSSFFIKGLAHDGYSIYQAACVFDLDTMTIIDVKP